MHRRERTLGVLLLAATAGCTGGTAVVPPAPDLGGDAGLDLAPERCPAPLLECGDACVEPRYDPNHCGSCGRVCAGGAPCLEGRCAEGCPGRLEECAGACVDLDVDRANCGACGVPCLSGELCVGGRCALVCPPGLTACEGRCVDLATDRGDCGRCGVRCGDGELCDAARCSPTCTPGLSACAGGCFDLLTSEAHCGRCGVACAGEATCEEGACTLTCAPGLSDCASTCVDLMSDVAHCGACDVICDAGDACLEGRCGLPCPALFTACGDLCVDTRFDPDHCGACGTVCARAEVCVSGACTAIDAPGQIIGIGHDFFERHPSADRILQNAMLATAERGTIDVLFYTEFADTGRPSGGSLADMQDILRATPARTVRIAEMASSGLLATRLTADIDVFVIPEVARGLPSYTTIAASWRPTLVDFIADGGIVILAYDDAYQFVVGPGLLEAEPGTRILETFMDFLSNVELATGASPTDPLLVGATLPYPNLSASGTLQNIRDVEALGVETGTLRPIIWRVTP